MTGTNYVLVLPTARIYTECEAPPIATQKYTNKKMLMLLLIRNSILGFSANFMLNEAVMQLAGLLISTAVRNLFQEYRQVTGKNDFVL